ncbi:hypothetical protein ABO04_03200 [Nitrosomonas sp. HPC101]|nr:hypothetical protein [Nitrosomonas sp. HPC101]
MDEVVVFAVIVSGLLRRTATPAHTADKQAGSTMQFVPHRHRILLQDSSCDGDKITEQPDA